MSATSSRIPNPWHALPATPCYVLPCDRDVVKEHNDTATEAHRYRLDLLPEPYFGHPEAPVVVLMGNPGVDDQDGAVHQQATFVQAARQSLLHASSPEGPFLHLRTSLKSPGRLYWESRTRALAQCVGTDKVKHGLLALQLSPYHSRKFKQTRHPIPSQAYTVQLLTAALERGALVLLMRGERHWKERAPLGRYGKRLIQAANPRCTYLTKGNLKEGWDTLVEELRR